MGKKPKDKPKKPKRLSATETAQMLAWTLETLLAALPQIDYTTASMAYVEAYHAAQDTLRENAALLAY